MDAAEAVDISCPFAQCQAYLTQIALFFCLWSCEYTKAILRMRTVQSHLKDLQFHDADGVISHNDPPKTVLCAWAVNLFLDMHNNSVQDKSTTTEATNLNHSDPISAADWRFLHLCSHHAEPDTTMCSYFLTKCVFTKSATITHIVSLPLLHAKNIGFQPLGFYPHKIGSHSLYFGGAMTLH